MGLFQRIQALSDRPKGLLYRAGVLRSSDLVRQEPTPPVSFFAKISRQADFSRSIILLPDGNLYTARDSYGFQPEDLQYADSTRDFWDGTLIQSDFPWIAVHGEELVPYLQLFSEHDRIDIRSLHICRMVSLSDSLDYIVLVPCPSEDHTFSPDVLQVFTEQLSTYLTGITE